MVVSLGKSLAFRPDYFLGLLAASFDNFGSALSNGFRLDSLEVLIVCFSFKLECVAKGHMKTVINKLLVFYDHILWAGYNILGNPVN